MSYRSAGQASGMRQQSLSASSQTTALQQRIVEKKAELENLKQLRDLSAGLAGQMEQLEEKLGTLSNGTEAVAAVLSNWHNVIRAISLASAKIPQPTSEASFDITPDADLPQTLVRIPIQQIKPAPDTSETVDGSGVR
ncbi:hypothetical protein CAC42_2076 [Sphaceloma murrayae]|uniref:DASH complex subunit DAD2 n=1 Tax=Sphaceloma murrayae TaxID=2082308 RepID=A0A2K1QI78_9PEZI|nr:hypothetical protein CAC42_2076 [Sphaceloma murrayae]